MQKQYIKNMGLKCSIDHFDILDKPTKSSSYEAPEQKYKVSKDYESIRNLVMGDKNTSKKKGDGKINII
jgi:hypothetical protein